MSKSSKESPASLLAPGHIISAADFARMTATSSTLRRVQAAQLVNVETMHRSGWTIGYRYGLQQAMSELSDFHGEVQRRQDDSLSPIRKIVFTVLRKILHDGDLNQLMASIAEKAVTECGEKIESVTILVHPEVAESVARRFANHRVPGMRISVQASEHLEKTGCEIHTVFGILDAGLDVQLDVLEQSVRRAVPEVHDD